MRTPCVCPFMLTLALAPGAAYAQARPAPPQTYSLTMSMGGGLTVNSARDGSKQSLEQIMPKSANGPGMHIRQIYDFSTHKYWTMDLEGGSCTLATYTSPALPASFDPVGAAAEMQAEIAKMKPAVLRTETVNGFATKVYEAPVEEIKGKMRIFVEEKYGFIVKQVLVMGNGKEQTSAEVKSVSFARPSPDLFVPPQNCRAQAGESSATGGHAEAEIGATAAGQKNLGGQQPAAAPAEIEIPGGGAVPAHYTGPAPAAFQFEFQVNATGPVTADWVLVSQGDTAWESGRIIFTAAGTKTLKIPVKIGVGNGQHWEGKGHLEVAVGGKRHSSPTVDISADCKAK